MYNPDLEGLYSPEEISALKEHIERIIAEEDPLNLVPRLVCPGIVGNDDAKLALSCLLASRYDTRKRQRIHLLYYGIPGTAKTGFIDWLVDVWDALYISMDAKESTLKGDGRRKDDGAKLLNAYDLGIVCLDDFEKFKAKDILRDVMEKGSYTQAKGGRYQELPARVRVIGACNDLSSIPDPIKSRFDIACYFPTPDIDESVEIAKALAADTEDVVAIDKFLRIYMGFANQHTPLFHDPDRLSRVFERHFKRIGSGETGRWIASVYRIASSIARLRLGDVTEKEVSEAIRIKVNSDEAMEM